MSLIEEALRKQREEQAPQTTPEPSTRLSLSSATTPPPPIPPPVAAEPQAAEAPAPRQAWPLLAGIMGIGVVLVVAIALLLFFGIKSWRTKPSAKPVPVAAAPGTKAASKSTPRQSSPTSAPPAAVPSTASPAPPVTRVTPEAALPPADTNPAPLTPSAAAPAQPAVVAAPPATSPAPVTATAASPSGTVSETGPSASTETLPPAQVQAPIKTAAVNTAVTPPEEKKSLVPWPRLTVTGLIGSARGRGAAIINGQTVGPGNTIEGVKIIAVEKQGVRVSFGGETRVLPAGSTTE